MSQKLGMSLVPGMVGLLGISKSYEGGRKPKQGDVRTRLNIKTRAKHVKSPNETSAQKQVIKLFIWARVRSVETRVGARGCRVTV